MALVESKKFFTRNLLIYAVAQFIITLLVYFGLYSLIPNYMEASSWRISVFFVAWVALINGLAPALLREQNKRIRLEGKSNPVYFLPIVILVIEALFLLIKMYYFWEFEVTKNDMVVGLLAYLVAMPVFSIFVYYTEKDI